MNILIETIIYLVAVLGIIIAAFEVSSIDNLKNLSSTYKKGKYRKNKIKIKNKIENQNKSKKIKEEKIDIYLYNTNTYINEKILQVIESEDLQDEVDINIYNIIDKE